MTNFEIYSLDWLKFRNTGLLIIPKGYEFHEWTKMLFGDLYFLYTLSSSPFLFERVKYFWRVRYFGNPRKPYIFSFFMIHLPRFTKARGLHEFTFSILKGEIFYNEWNILGTPENIFYLVLGKHARSLWISKAEKQKIKEIFSEPLNS